MPEKKVGKIVDYYSHVGAVAIELEDNLKTGDKIHITGHTTNFTQTIESIQIEHNKVNEAKKGETIGIKVTERVRKHDVVYKVTE